MCQHSNFPQEFLGMPHWVTFPIVEDITELDGNGLVPLLVPSSAAPPPKKTNKKMNE